MFDPKNHLRPTIPSIKKKISSSLEEQFQNKALRPIIKLQHKLIISCFEQYLTKNKINLHVLSDEQRKAVIEKAFARDTRLKTDMRSLIIGLFTLEEYNEYLSNQSQINKRINSIIQERIGSVFILPKSSLEDKKNIL